MAPCQPSWRSMAGADPPACPAPAITMCGLSWFIAPLPLSVARIGAVVVRIGKPAGCGGFRGGVESRIFYLLFSHNGECYTFFDSTIALFGKNILLCLR